MRRKGISPYGGVPLISGSWEEAGGGVALGANWASNTSAGMVTAEAIEVGTFKHFESSGINCSQSLRDLCTLT